MCQAQSESEFLQLNRLKDGIEELREVLNETCATLEENEKDEKRLAISERLDDLIVEYMKELNRVSKINKKISDK